MLSQSYGGIIDHGVSTLGHGRYMVDGIDATNKHYIFHLTDTVTLPVSKYYATQIDTHSAIDSVDFTLS